MGTDIHGFRVEIASPCAASWASMSGTDRVRFCALCRKKVYELSGMSRGEIRALFDANPTVCLRFFVRDDGTLITEDCPLGVRVVRKARRWALASLAGIVATTVLVLAAILGWAQVAAESLRLRELTHRRCHYGSTTNRMAGAAERFRARMQVDTAPRAIMGKTLAVRAPVGGPAKPTITRY